MLPVFKIVPILLGYFSYEAWIGVVCRMIISGGIQQTQKWLVSDHVLYDTILRRDDPQIPPLIGVPHWY